jgi:serine/threonine protein kinase
VSVYPRETSNLAPGYRLDRYELLFPIGTGGMASVWVARLLGKHGFEKLCAIKTILPHFARDPHFQQMFLDEARIASRIHHTNVAQILDLGDQQGVLFLAMEWIDGDALSKLAYAVHHRGETFPIRIVLRILADVCAGLHAAHELCDRNGMPLGVVHRDVSPHNILINEQGVAKIIDFGIAKARDRVSGDTDTGTFRGKIKYMAPEQALSPRSTDRRADLWAVGAILYFLLSGNPPYDRENDIATLTQLASGRPPLPLANSVPQSVRAIATRALAWERGERYATAAEFQAALEDAMTEMEDVATNADVAAFCAWHLADRTEARKKSVALALSAAEERARVSILLAPANEDSAEFPRRSKVGSSPDAEALKPPMDAAPRSRVSETSPTLGTAATMTTNPATPGAVPLTRHWPIAAALMSFATVAAGVFVFAMVHRGGSAASAERPPAQPSAEAVATQAVPPPAPTASVAVTETPSAPSAEASAGAKGVPTVPAARRRRPTPAGPPTPNRDSPVAPATTKHRAEYGF